MRKTMVIARSILFPRSLRYQLLSRSILILVGLFITVGILQYWSMQRLIYMHRAESIQQQIRSIPGEAWGISSGAIRGPEPPSKIIVPNASIGVMAADGDFRIISRDPGTRSVPVLPNSMYLESMNQTRERPSYEIVRDHSGAQLLAVLQPVRVHNRVVGVVQITMPLERLQEEIHRQFLIYFGLSTAAIAVGFVTFLPVLRTLLVPFTRMRHTITRLNAGNLHERLPTNQGQVEIDNLSASLNHMLERLEASFRAEKEAKEQMRRFIADASHELRTPLTSIQGFIEILLRGAAENHDQLYQALHSMQGESNRLCKLVQDLLLLAKLDRAPEADWSDRAIADIVSDMEPHLHLLAGERQVTVHIDSHRSTRLDANKMKQVILNLFQNAVQHTDPGSGVIRIAVTGPNKGVTLTVHDNGPGIAPEHLPHIFDRLYRVEPSRTRKHGGVGLGLSITKSIVDLHHGSIEVESSEETGTLFRIWFP